MIAHSTNKHVAATALLAALSFLVVSCSTPKLEERQVPPPDSIAAPGWAQGMAVYAIDVDRFNNGNRFNDPPGTDRRRKNHSADRPFGGDLFGIRQRIWYLRSLKINAVCLSPVFTGNLDPDYPTSDYLKIDPAFGTEKDLETVVAKCHENDIRVILDINLVYTGTEFFAFRDVLQRQDSSQYRSWFFISDFPVRRQDPPPYRSWRGRGDLPLLNTASPAVRKYLFDAIRKWTAPGIDGWRVLNADALPADFLKALREFIKSIDPDLLLIGEVRDNVAARLQGDEFDAVQDEGFRRAVTGFFARDSLAPSQFDAAIRNRFKQFPSLVPAAAWNTASNPHGKRFLSICEDSIKRALQAAFFQLTTPGTPVIHYGEEMGLAAPGDNRPPISWEPSDWNNTVINHYRNLLALRREYPILRFGAFSKLLADDVSGVYAYELRYKNRRAVCVLNRSDVHVDATLPLPALRWREKMFGNLYQGTKQGLRVRYIPPRSSLLFLQE